MNNDLKEITKEQAINLPIGTFYMIYNPLTNTYKQELTNDKDIVHNKHCYEGLKYYVFVDKEFEKKKEYFDEAIKINPKMLEDLNFIEMANNYFKN